MKNIHSTWTHFNKKQKQSIKKSSAFDWNRRLESLSDDWGSLDYPNNEYWKYVSFNQLPLTSFNIPESKNLNQCLVGEKFIEIEINDFSGSPTFKIYNLPKGLSVSSTVDEINNRENTQVEELMIKKEERNPFSQIALSFISSGLVLKLAENVILEKPIKIILNLNKSNQKDVLVVFNFVAELGDHSSAEIFIEVQGQDLVGLANLKTDIKLNKGAKLSLFNKEIGGDQSHIFNNVSLDLEESASLKSYDVTLPSLWTRHNLSVNLKKDKSHTELYGIYLNNKHYFSDHHTEINHLHKNTTSQENYRGLLTDSAKSVFNGKIFIEKKASKSESELVNKNLMLSKKAEIFTKPELQIYNDDVKAAHGATVGSMDPEQRFYLLSRGFTEKKTNQVLSQAFINEVFDKENEETKDFFKQDIEKILFEMVGE